MSQTKASFDAFRALGWKGRPFEYHLERGGLVTRVLRRGTWAVRGMTVREAYDGLFNDCLRKEVIPYLVAKRPTLLFVLRPGKIDSENYRALAALDTRVVFWTVDSLTRYPEQNCLRPLARNAFYLDGGDPSKEGDAWLPLGYEEGLFEDLPVGKTIDVLFVGLVTEPGYSTRKRLLLELKHSAIPRKYRCVFVGTTGSRFGDLKLSAGGDLECMGVVPTKEFVKLIAAAKVCVNVHQDDGVKPINSSFVQIPAAGTCQLAEDREYLAEWLEPGKDYVQFPRTGFIDTLEELLRNPELQECVARRGQETARRHHGFINRVQRILAAEGLT
jgi:hypothetical protein